MAYEAMFATEALDGEGEVVARQGGMRWRACC
jgi:hypothetical protein